MAEIKEQLEYGLLLFSTACRINSVSFLFTFPYISQLFYGRKDGSRF